MQTLPLHDASVRVQERENRRKMLSGYLAVVGAGLLIGINGLGFIANPFALSFAALACMAAAILFRPIAGVYLTVVFSVVDGGGTMYGYPFNANFSSGQSFLYLSDALTFSPLEICLALTLVSWFMQMAGARDWRLRGRPLLWPMLLFGAFALLGLVNGVFVGGGNISVALWELRPLLYLVVIYVLASNLLTRTAHYVSLAWLVVGAITVQSLFALRFYYSLTPGERELMDGLGDHSTSLFYNWVFLLLAAVWVLRNCSYTARLLLAGAAAPVAYTFVLAERRAAAVALLAGFILFAVVLFFRRRKVFYVLVPAVLILTVGYTAAFWNATEGVGFGAQAIKTVIAPNDVSETDASSNLYREIENYDLSYTIRASPIQGVGFGVPFQQPIALPDISFFVFYEYIPHNSILWIWLKTGFVGFVVLLFAYAVVLRAGTRAAMTLPSGDTLAVAVAALAFVIMFVVFAYVDIAWSPQTCTFLGACMATCANLVRLAQADRQLGSDDEPPEVDAGREPLDWMAELSMPGPR